MVLFWRFTGRNDPLKHNVGSPLNFSCKNENLVLTLVDRFSTEIGSTRLSSSCRRSTVGNRSRFDLCGREIRNTGVLRHSNRTCMRAYCMSTQEGCIKMHARTHATFGKAPLGPRPHTHQGSHSPRVAVVPRILLLIFRSGQVQVGTHTCATLSLLHSQGWP